MGLLFVLPRIWMPVTPAQTHWTIHSFLKVGTRTVPISQMKQFRHSCWGNFPNNSHANGPRSYAVSKNYWFLCRKLKKWWFQCFFVAFSVTKWECLSEIEWDNFRDRNTTLAFKLIVVENWIDTWVMQKETLFFNIKGQILIIIGQLFLLSWIISSWK